MFIRERHTRASDFSKTVAKTFALRQTYQASTSSFTFEG